MKSFYIGSRLFLCSIKTVCAASLSKSRNLCKFYRCLDRVLVDCWRSSWWQSELRGAAQTIHAEISASSLRSYRWELSR
ncbi:hypothetical protein BKA62DRAFT_725006, partial [Auriculariales sp. MPI-PUGE-AT-0066]